MCVWMCSDFPWKLGGACEGRWKQLMSSAHQICRRSLSFIDSIHSGSVCARTDDACVLDTVQGSGPPGLPGFLPLSFRSQSTGSCIYTSTSASLPSLLHLTEKKEKTINKTDNLDKTRSSDVTQEFQFRPFASLLICLCILFLEVHISGGAFQTSGN